MARCCRCWFRAPARCRSETGAPGGWGTRVGGAQRHRCWFRAPARCRSETGVPSRPRASSRWAMRDLAARRAAAPGELAMIGSACSPRPYESAVPGWCTSRSPSHQAERHAGKGTPTSGRHSPPQAGGREGPRVRGGSPLGRDLGVQRHPGGCVVHAFRCALRGGAGPHRENWPEVGVPSGRCHLLG